MNSIFCFCQVCTSRCHYILHAMPLSVRTVDCSYVSNDSSSKRVWICLDRNVLLRNPEYIRLRLKGLFIPKFLIKKKKTGFNQVKQVLAKGKWWITLHSWAALQWSCATISLTSSPPHLLCLSPSLFTSNLKMTGGTLCPCAPPHLRTFGPNTLQERAGNIHHGAEMLNKQSK